ncbi:type II toxin-antitoxin system HicB family antitoxin [Lysobacter xanthus]
MQYFAFIERDENRHYSITLPDFMGCVTEAQRLADVTDAARQAVSVHLSSCVTPLGKPMRAEMLPPSFETREGYWMLVDLAPVIAEYPPGIGW